MIEEYAALAVPVVPALILALVCVAVAFWSGSTQRSKLSSVIAGLLGLAILFLPLALDIAGQSHVRDLAQSRGMSLSGSVAGGELLLDRPDDTRVHCSIDRRQEPLVWSAEYTVACVG